MRFKILFLLCFSCFGAAAQQGFRLNVMFSEDAKTLSKLVSWPKEVKDSLAVYKEAEKVVSQLQFNGHLLAEITDIAFAKNEASINIKANKLYRWVNLSIGNLPLAISQNVGFRERNYKEARFNVNDLKKLFEALLVYYENNGYPFASVSLQQIYVDEQAISASLDVKPYQQLLFDTLQIVGSAQIGQKN